MLADGGAFDFFCGDEVYGSCTALREFLETRGQAYVLRVPRNFRLSMPGGLRFTCADAAARLAADGHREVRSAGTGARGQRWYGWSWLATASPRHHLLIRRHLKTGELAFHYCFVPEGQPGQLPNGRCPTSEAPPLTAELRGPLGASVQVSASSQLTAVAVGGHHGASHNGE